MSKTAVINIKLRPEMTKGEKHALIRQGYVLGNINGKGKPSVAMAVKKDDLRKVLHKEGRNAVLKLVADNKDTYDAMLTDIQLSPMLYEYHHVDFQQVELNQEIKSHVSVVFEGVDILESRHFLVNRHMDNMTVIGLPKNIPDHIVIDVTTLQAGDAIKVGDIKYPKGITPDADADAIVITIGEARVREAVAETESEEE